MIAHRLETANRFCDKVMVLDQGSLVEFDSPFKLLVKKVDDNEITSEGVFAQMVSAMGPQQAQNFLDKARKNYLK